MLTKKFLNKNPEIFDLDSLRISFMVLTANNILKLQKKLNLLKLQQKYRRLSKFKILIIVQKLYLV